MKILVARRHIPILHSINPAIKFTTASVTAATFILGETKFKELRMAIFRKNKNPRTLMVWPYA